MKFKNALHGAFFWREISGLVETFLHCFNKSGKEGRGGERARFELGVGLGCDEEVVVFSFDKFDEFSVGRGSGDFETALFDFFSESEVDFVTVAMAFGDRGFSVDFSDF